MEALYCFFFLLFNTEEAEKRKKNISKKRIRIRGERVRLTAEYREVMSGGLNNKAKQEKAVVRKRLKMFYIKKELTLHTAKGRRKGGGQLEVKMKWKNKNFLPTLGQMGEFKA